MKNIRYVATQPVIRIPLTFVPPLQGWAVKLLQDLPDDGPKKGWWLDLWHEGPQGVDLRFAPDRNMAFNLESQAQAVRDHLRSHAEIETEVVKIGNPQAQGFGGNNAR
jgi:hypothetical protein